MIAMNLHKILHLYETSDEFYILPVDRPNEALIIDRQTSQLSLSGEFSNSRVPANATLSMIYGIIGIKHVGGCPYLIVITAATKIGLIDEKPIYRMDRARLVAYDGDLEGSNGDLVSMMESFLETPHFYFSYEYNLTNSLQRNCHKAQSDQRFLWNAHMMIDSYDQYRLPLILGFVSINPIEPSCSGLKWTLISRRSVKRAGTRFNCRGIDEQGNVANFVETEHILEAKSARLLTSFVQIRGSIPLTWSQRPDYRYKPAIKIDKHDGLMPMKRHFDDLIEHYDRVSVVNLIDSRGHEGELEHEFSQRMAQVQQYYDNSNYIPYHYFDFHKECAKMRWHRLDVLLTRIEGEIQKYGFFVCQNGSVMQNQSGIIRSNCIDSLDRTNVIQSMIAGRVLLAQEELLSGMLSSPLLSGFGPESSMFKNVWADNADTLSIQYAGTPALKTDFTRTGRRTYLGQLQDGLNSATRYVTNNFYDQYRQDAIDLFLGLYAGPSHRSRDLTTYTSKFYVTTVVLILVMLYFYLRH